MTGRYPRGIPRAPEPWPDEVQNRLEREWFERDPRLVARNLLGGLLVTVRDGVITGGRIVETEAYLGSHDPGSHASTRGVTARNVTMYGPAGHTYVYFTYGNHHMLNLVCEADGTAGAVLIRALEPLLGLDAMSARRGGRIGRQIASGPGKVAQALGVDLEDNGIQLNEGRILVYDAADVAEARVAVSGRIGLSSGYELEYRYYLQDSLFVSKGRTGPPR